MNERVNYLQFRKRFLDNSHANRFSVINIHLCEELFIDISFKILDPKLDWVVHISGNHGIEGYVGSTIQSQALEDFTFQNFGKNIMFVHALNPYGMKYFRRMNSENIDLNRNALVEKERLELHANHSYHKYLEWNHSENYLVFVWKTLTTLFQLRKLGIDWEMASREVAQGQLLDKHSLFYCGEHLSDELKILKFYLEQIIEPTKNVFVIDVHSGLGDYMKESLIVEYFDPSEFKYWKDHFKDSELIIPDETKGYYKVNGGLSYLFKKQSSFKSTRYIYQEFGTKPSFDVIGTLILENHHFKTRGLKLQDHYDNKFSDQMLDCFFPSNEDWQQFCLKQGLLRLKQVLEPT